VFLYKTNKNNMNLKHSQLDVTTGLRNGVRYFNELTNMAQLTEEVGEVARIIAVVTGNNQRKKAIK
jgi:NTP pyrophosphatase (non-canonical NTP hydrolase)